MAGYGLQGCFHESCFSFQKCVPIAEHLFSPCLSDDTIIIQWEEPVGSIRLVFGGSFPRTPQHSASEAKVTLCPPSPFLATSQNVSALWCCHICTCFCDSLGGRQESWVITHPFLNTSTHTSLVSACLTAMSNFKRQGKYHSPMCPEKEDNQKYRRVAPISNMIDSLNRCSQCSSALLSKPPLTDHLLWVRTFLDTLYHYLSSF